MNNEKSSLQEKQSIRPQEPQSPYSYFQQEVGFENKIAGITLSGTLTLPKTDGPFPVVILISGMGPMDRDGTFNYHKPLWVIADHLTRQGIAVLRFDKRGVGKSTGTFDLNVTTKDLAGDVLAGVQYLKTHKEIESMRIGLVGHSEGGLIAAMVASESKDVSFVVLMAGAVANSSQDLAE